MQINTEKIYSRLKELIFSKNFPTKSEREELKIMLAKLELVKLGWETRHLAVGAKEQAKIEYPDSEATEDMNVEFASRIIGFLLERFYQN